MVPDENSQVNVTRQCIYAAVPGLDIYSAYRIKHLRKYIAVILAAIVVPQLAIEFALFGDMLDIRHAYTAFVHPESEYFVQSAYVMAWTVAGIAASVALIRRWSVQWNNSVTGIGP